MPLPCTVTNIYPTPFRWADWAQREGNLSTGDEAKLEEHKPRRIPTFAYNKTPFDFDEEAKKELLESSFRPLVPDQDLLVTRTVISNLVTHDPTTSIDELFKNMYRAGYDKAL